MVSLEARAVETDGISLVVATLVGGSLPTRVTVENRLDGPVWPPRRMGRPEAGWDESGYAGVVPAGDRRPLGYACPAPADDPPLAVVDRQPAAELDDEFDSADAVLRGLGSPAPPRAAVPLPADGREPDTGGEADGLAPSSANGDWFEASTATRATDPSASGSDAAPDAPDEGPDRRGPAATSPDAGAPASCSNAEAGGPSSGAEVTEASSKAGTGPANSTAGAGGGHSRPREGVPEPVAAWFDHVEARLDRAEPLSTAGDVPGATAALRAVGSLVDARALEERRRTDAARLREVATRANALAYRAERAAIPVETLERLA